MDVVGRSRRLDIQGLRAVAVLMVVAFHAGAPLPGGFVGVDVFFVISGFVITGMLHREWVSTGHVRFIRFYLRRFKRLTPALALMIAVTVFISAFVLSPLGTQQTTAKTAIGAMLLVANVVIARTTGGYFDAPAETNPLLNTWSLSVEEQFYLVFPGMVVMGWVIARRRNSLGVVPYLLIALVALTSFGLASLTSTLWSLPDTPGLLGFYSAGTRAWEFAVGALLALGLARHSMKSSKAGLAFGLVGLAMLAASFWTISGATPFPGLWTVLPVTGTLLLILSGASGRNHVTRALSVPPMVKIGDWSYSIYLWHWPFIVFAGLLWPDNPWAVLCAAALSLVPAISSYRWVEQPIRAISGLGSRKSLAMVVTTVTVPILLAGLMGGVASRVWIPRIQGQAGDALAVPIGYELGCHFDEEKTGTPGVCWWNESLSGRPVYLVGDSNAAHFTEALRGATASTGQPLAISTASSCPALKGIDLQFRGRPQYTGVCRYYADRTLAWLANASPGVVILSASDHYWLDSEIGIPRIHGEAETEPSVKTAMFERALEGTVNSLEGAGHRVILIHTIPHWDDWNLASCTLRETLSGCVRSMPQSSAQSRSQIVRSALSRVGTRTGAEVADVGSFVCPGGLCLTRRDGRWIYRDARHITNDESRRLASTFVGVLRPPDRSVGRSDRS